VMHLLYARFFTRVLRDLGLVRFSEPFRRLYNQGIILGEDNEKMSKSRGNVVNPDDYVAQMGADTVRTYLMFLGPWSGGGPWNSQGIQGPYRFLNTVWELVLGALEQPPPARGDAAADAELARLAHKSTKIVTERYDGFQYNTMLAELHTYRNGLQRLRGRVSARVWRDALERLVLMVAPAAPHLAEELWHRLGHEASVHLQSWPTWDEALTVEDRVVLVIQINGKVRDQIEVAPGLSEADVRPLVLAQPKIQALLNGHEVVRLIYVPNKLVNLVIK
jgi:leucyl-tRNA synthetase